MSTTDLGAALASQFAKTDSYVARVGAAGAAGAALASTFLSKENDASSGPEPQPDHTVLLMRGHGFTAIGSNVQEAVFRAVYTQQNAGVQTTAMMLRNAQMGAVERGKGREEREKGVQDEGVRWLGDAELGDCREFGRITMGRPWGLWAREVEAVGLYVNEA